MDSAIIENTNEKKKGKKIVSGLSSQ